MSQTAIRVENLTKRFRLGTRKERYVTLRDSLMQAVTTPFRRVAAAWNGHANDELPNEIWALRDVSFEVKRGDVVGIIGRNGAGKSTLLKVLARITEPTTGRVCLKGRVGSLLEVGTGFHPELTGRENIYLNGAILGMRRQEINRKFDEMVAFAELEKFLDTPVKHYSSGMYMRLAFAVAAHLESEILLVDEVLAVGDAAFQKKCLGKMDDVARQGRTVLFVSHNMGAIMELCPTAIILDQGRLISRGTARQATQEYLASIVRQESTNLRYAQRRSGDGRLRFVAAYLRNETGGRTALPVSGHPIDIVLEFETQEELAQVQFMLTIFNHIGIAVTHCNMDAEGKRFRLAHGRGQVICRIPKLPLPQGQYKIAVLAEDHINQLDWVPTACVFDVESSVFFATAFMPSIEYSTALVEHSWDLVKEPKNN
ncbi:MAG TPA: ABC transporter ATP-binding protein [Verrucomicrobiae bacterium]|nr:ABC transporter ATP-binding protein [Verrucomicrobiae bacterium]